MSHVTVDVCTKDRYQTELPMTLMSIAMQTNLPDEVVIYDDSIDRIDMRENQALRYIFMLFDQKQIRWRVIHGFRQGQHIGHQIIQGIAKDLVWRIDDDEVAEPQTLERLLSNITDGVGAVGGLVLPPEAISKECFPNKIDRLDDNCQWYKWKGKKEVEHLYSSYLYKKGIQDYEIHLSQVAHREETLHSYGIFKKGYKLIVDGSAVTWHLRSSIGGIRTGKEENWHKDEITFREIMREYQGDKVCVLNSGKGDHIVFRTLLPKIKAKYNNVILAVCYPELFLEEKCISIDEGSMICNIDRHDISKWCTDHNWNKEIKYAYAEMYEVEI
jgi:hypothetical protein